MCMGDVAGVSGMVRGRLIGPAHRGCLPLDFNIAGSESRWE